MASWGKKSMYGKTFLGVIRTTRAHRSGRPGRPGRPKVKVEGHAAEVLKVGEGPVNGRTQLPHALSTAIFGIINHNSARICAGYAGVAISVKYGTGGKRACLVGHSAQSLTVIPAIPPMSGSIRRRPQRPPGRWRGGYTFVHAGRQVRLGPIAFWVVVGTLVIMAVWTITTATYFAFRDDVLTRLITRQAKCSSATRIASPSCARRSIALQPAIARSGTVRAKARPNPAPAIGVEIACERAE